MEERELPVGWELTTLSNAAVWGSGGTPSRTNSEYYGGIIPWVKTGELGPRILMKTEESITESGLLNSSAKIFPAGSIAVAMYGATIGKASILGIEAATNQACAVGLAQPEVTSKEFLFHYLCSQRDAFTTAGKGGAQPNISQGLIKEWTFPLPPLNEQRRIAAKLDTTLAAVDACRQRLDGVAAILKRFRQAVLAAATSGELSREGREENCIHGEWEEGYLYELLSSKPRNGYSPKPADHETAIKSLTLSATTTGRFKPEHFKYIDQVIPSESHLWLAPGDILIQRANTLEYVGISAIYNGPEKTFIYPDLMIKCRANDKVDTQFLHYLLLSEAVRNYFRQSATGTSGNMPKINQQIVMSAPVRWPTLDEQLEIVRRAQELFTLADQLEARLTDARKLVDRLTPALLAKAFRGELVPQDPGDEPASVLLERIRAARQAEAAASGPPRRGRKKAAANPATVALEAAPAPADCLAALLRECGALSERALLAASELEPARFRAQLTLERQRGAIRDTPEDSGQVLLEASA